MRGDSNPPGAASPEVLTSLEARELSVLHVTDCVGGGVPNAIRDHIARSSHVQHTIAWPEANNVEHGEKEGATVFSLTGGMLSRWRQVRSLIQRVAPDVIIAHSSAAGLWVRTSPRRENALRVYQPHAFAFEAYNRGPVFRLTVMGVEKALAFKTDRFIALTEREKASAHRLTSTVRVDLIPNGVTSRVGREDSRRRCETQTSTGNFTIVSIGRLAAQKDPAFFAEVASLVLKENPRFRFIWVGDGESRHRHALEGAGVEVTGWLNAVGIDEILDHAHVYFHSAVYEGFPLTVLEAAAHSVPIIVRRIAAFQSENLTKVSTVEQAAQAIKALSQDSEQYASALRASELLASKYSSEKQAKKLDSFYASIGKSNG